MLMIRLRRGGTKKKPIYRVVVSDSRKRTTSDYIEQVGFYNPHTAPKDIRFDFEKVKEWQAKGATCSATVRSLIEKASTRKP